jgi:hypothetical protein
VFFLLLCRPAIVSIADRVRWWLVIACRNFGRLGGC